MPMKSLKQKTALAFIWCVLRTGIEQGFSFVIFLFLGRLLTPADFGVVALAAGVVEVVRLFSLVGLYEAMIRLPVLDELAADTAFWTSVALGAVLAGGVVLLGKPVALLFGQPLLAQVVPVMSLIVIASSLGNAHTGRLARDFGHRALAMRSLAANIAGGFAALAVMLSGGGLWALVAQRLAAEIVQSAAVWYALRWIPRLRFSFAELKGMSGFSARMTLANLIIGINMRVQESVVGLYLPVAAVGSLRIASRLTDLIQQLVFLPANQATMVAFSRLQEERANLQRGYRQALRLAGLVAFPCFIGLAAVGPELVPWMFGQQWVASVPILQALCFAVVPITVQFFMAPVLVAVGQAGGLALFAVFNLGLGVVVTVLSVRFGIVAVAIALTLRGWVLLPVALVLLKRACGVRVGTFAEMAPPFVAALLAALPVLGLQTWLKGSLPLPLLMAVQMAAYGLSYAALLYLGARGFMADAADSLMPLVPPRMQGKVRRIFRLDDGGTVAASEASGV